MRIVVDGDACPGIFIVRRIARKYGLELIAFYDIHHYITLDYGEVKVVDSGFQSVDMYVVNIRKSNNVIISQDCGVAAICLGKKAHILDPKGHLYTEEDIDRMLEEGHISQKIRRAGGRTSNPKKRTSEDDLRLEKSLIETIGYNFRE